MGFGTDKLGVAGTIGSVHLMHDSDWRSISFPVGVVMKAPEPLVAPGLGAAVPLSFS